MLAHDALGQPSSTANEAGEENHEHAPPREPHQELRSNGDRASSSPRQNLRR